MKAPLQIKHALECIAAAAREKSDCASCAYRREPDCIRAAVQDAAVYIKALEKTARKVPCENGGRLRTVYLYTVTNDRGEVLCEDLPRAEAAAALGYSSTNGIQYAWSCQQKGMQMPIRIERRKGLIGNKGPLIERPPKWLYTVERPDGSSVLRDVNMRDLARHFGLTEEGMHSACTRCGMQARGVITYRALTIKRRNAKEG